MNIEHRTSNTCLGIAFAEPDRMLNAKRDERPIRQRALAETSNGKRREKMNIEHRTSNTCLGIAFAEPDRILNGKDEETEELIKIFVTSIKTAEKKPRLDNAICHLEDTICRDLTCAICHVLYIF